jgi:hypothetical protein
MTKMLGRCAMKPTDEQLTICTVLCKSRKFETGAGTCAFICLDQLGNARRDCSHKHEVFGKLAMEIMEALNAKTNR